MTTATRTQRPTPAYPTVTFADAVADCPVHRAEHEAAEVRYAEFVAENGASIERRNRIQLGLRPAKRNPAVTA
jgi:hypothetical protein